jgi:uncharacterized protein YcbK (DUF882 family)
MGGLASCSWRAGQRAGFAAVFLLSGAQGLQNVVAEGDTRALSLHHIHTGEDITITYKRAGRYDDEALKKLDWFLRDWRREQSTHMDPHLLDVIWEVYRDVDAKEPIQVVCGYRSPQTNAMLRRRSRGVAQYSQHVVGRAMDFYVPGVALEQLRYAGLRLQRGGVGFYPGSGSPFVHLDTGSVRHWPRMSHDQLARLFRDGKTVHLPADGKPLPHYAEALKDVRRRGGNASPTLLAQAHDAGAIVDEDASEAPAEKPKRSLLAKLFGFGAEQEASEAAERDASGRRAASTQHGVEAKPVRVTSAVPVPPARPQRPAQFQLASAGSSPAQPAAARENAAAAVTALAESADAKANASAESQRFVWLPGPQGQPAPRPPQEILVADADPEPTASIETGAARNDRVPTDLALAYAATAPAAIPEPPPRAQPMGSLEAPAPVAAPAPAPRATVKAGGEPIRDPWLRGIVVAPSVQYSMQVSPMGPTDYRSLRPLLVKPSFAVAMTFSEDPHFGMDAAGFGGAAVSFLPTVIFPSRTARLNR